MQTIVDKNKPLHLKYEIIGGPSLMDLNRSHMRCDDSPAFEVQILYRNPPLHGYYGDSCEIYPLINMMERPAHGKRFWKIVGWRKRADRHSGCVYVVLLYDPERRDGYIDFFNGYPGVRFSAICELGLETNYPNRESVIV